MQQPPPFVLGHPESWLYLDGRNYNKPLLGFGTCCKQGEVYCKDLRWSKAINADPRFMILELIGAFWEIARRNTFFCEKIESIHLVHKTLFAESVERSMQIADIYYKSSKTGLWKRWNDWFPTLPESIFARFPLRYIVYFPQRSIVGTIRLVVDPYQHFF